MVRTKSARRGAVVTPHHLASQAGLAVLRDGGNAVEAMIAVAATIAVVYPYANSIGGDGFWLIGEPGIDPLAIDASGAAGHLATLDFYRERQIGAIPSRGIMVANTVAGTISGWQLAHDLARKLGGKLPLSRLLEDAIYYAREGFPVAANHAKSTRDNLAALRDLPGFAPTYLDAKGQPIPASAMWRQPKLAATLERLATAGLDDFYRGELAVAMAAELERLGSPLRRQDFAAHKASFGAPLHLDHSAGRVFNTTAPTQGVASLMILGIFDRLRSANADTVEHAHLLVEAIKAAFRVRDKHIADPSLMSIDTEALLAPAALDRMAAGIDHKRAAPWPPLAEDGDTIWSGCIDGEGRAVSFIQSVYWQYGSGVVLRDTGVLWQNRGTAFTLKEGDLRQLRPGKKPFHTLNPAYARLKDGRTISYGTMGAHGQPQTQAILFTRYVDFGQELQQAVSGPRWFLGRTSGGTSDSLKIENRWAPELTAALRAMGHDTEIVGPYENMMGHAGMLVAHPSGVIEAASDPRSDGTVAAF